MEKEQLWQQGQVKTYYSRLTDIMREYIENRYDIQALELTTDEILEKIEKVNVHDELLDKLKSMLQTADMVKFAKAKPAVEQHTGNMENAHKFVVKTKYVPPVIEEDDEIGKNDELKR